MAQHNLDALDKKILRLIADDARMPFLEVARICNVSGAAIHQRIQKLTNLGVIKGSQFIIDPEKIGYETCAYIGLFLKDPGQFDFVLDHPDGRYFVPEIEALGGQVYTLAPFRGINAGAGFLKFQVREQLGAGSIFYSYLTEALEDQDSRAKQAGI